MAMSVSDDDLEPLTEVLQPSEDSAALSRRGLAFIAAGALGLLGAVAGYTSVHQVQKAPAAPRELQEWFCNTLQQAVPVYSTPFQMTGDWEWKCKGQGLAPPPSEVDKFPGQQNWCWNWVKHKGCKDQVAKMNWKDGQAVATAAGLAPDRYWMPMDPVQNPEICEAYELGATLQPQPGEAEAAKAWLVQNVAIYVLTLPAETERIQFMQTRMDELGLPFSFLYGVDLRVQGSYAKAKTDGIIPMDFNFQLANTNGDGVAGMVGVAAAHLGNMQTIATNGQTQSLAVVLENDVRLEDDFALKLRNLLNNEAPCDWQVISLKSACPYGACVTQHLTRVMPDVNEPEARCRHGVNYGFYGMLYKVSELNDVRAKLGQRVWDANTPHCLDVDVALASISDQVSYYAVPYWQAPGFLQMGGHGSTRNDNNHAQYDVTEPYR